MHHRLLVTFDKRKALSSQEARQYAMDTLLADRSFCGEGGRFGSPLADWFVIGGRWSGELTKVHLDTQKVEEFQKAFGDEYGWWVGGMEQITEETRRSQAEELFKKYFPEFEGNLPYWRNTYLDLGFDDDAMVVDEMVYDMLLKEHEGTDGDKENFIDLDFDTVSKEFIGRKWIVVVDYHY